MFVLSSVCSIPGQSGLRTVHNARDGVDGGVFLHFLAVAGFEQVSSGLELGL